MLAFPVLGELPADPEAELTMLNLFGGELSEESRLFRALDDLLPGTGNGGYAGEDGKPLSREEIMRSLRTEVIQELATTNAEFEERLIGTEWLLEDFYRRQYARFLPGGKMLQQHVEGEDHLRMNGEYRLMERS